jgi:hypothetical protein
MYSAADLADMPTCVKQPGITYLDQVWVAGDVHAKELLS